MLTSWAADIVQPTQQAAAAAAWQSATNNYAASAAGSFAAAAAAAAAAALLLLLLLLPPLLILLVCGHSQGMSCWDRLEKLDRRLRHRPTPFVYISRFAMFDLMRCIFTVNVATHCHTNSYTASLQPVMCLWRQSPDADRASVVSLLPPVYLGLLASCLSVSRVTQTLVDGLVTEMVQLW